jgi:hypothetical protein
MKIYAGKFPISNSKWGGEISTVYYQAIKKVNGSIRVIDIRSFLAFFLPFLLYITTVAPTIYNLDSAELTTAAATGGIVRATGYPLYLTIGHLWSKIPIGDVGFRMNLFSAFCGALTIMFADRILRRWQVGKIAAFGALGLLATGTYFWGLSLIAEVYTLHTALMAALILALLRWSEKPTPSQMAMIGLITGLGLSHHLATILLIPGIIFFILTNFSSKSITHKHVISGAIGLIIGLGFYLYIPFRYLEAPAFNYAGIYDNRLQFDDVNLLTMNGLIWLVSARVFTGQMFAYTGIPLLTEFREFSILLAQSFFVFGIAPGFLGMYSILRNNWRQGVTLFLLFSFNAIFYIDYRVIDKDTMFLPTFLIWALWLGLGYQYLFTWLKDTLEGARFRKWGLILIRGSVIGAVVIALIWNWRITDLSEDYSARERAESTLALVENNALIFGWWDTVPVIQYLQLVEGQRPDVTAINRFLIPYGEMLLAIQHELDNRPVYINSVSADISSFAISEQRGLIYELLPRDTNFRGEK